MVASLLLMFDDRGYPTGYMNILPQISPVAIADPSLRYWT